MAYSWLVVLLQEFAEIVSYEVEFVWPVQDEMVLCFSIAPFSPMLVLPRSLFDNIAVSDGSERNRYNLAFLISFVRRFWLCKVVLVALLIWVEQIGQYDIEVVFMSEFLILLEHQANFFVYFHYFPSFTIAEGYFIEIINVPHLIIFHIHVLVFWRRLTDAHIRYFVVLFISKYYLLDLPKFIPLRLDHFIIFIEPVSQFFD